MTVDPIHPVLTNCAKFKLPILGVMQKILDEQAAAAIKITAWLRKYLVRRVTTAVVANS